MNHSETFGNQFDQTIKRNLFKRIHSLIDITLPYRGQQNKLKQNITMISTTYRIFIDSFKIFLDVFKDDNFFILIINS